MSAELTTSLTFDLVGRLAASIVFVGDGHQHNAEVLVEGFTGRECVDAHNYLTTIDQLLKARWRATGQVDPQDLC